MDEPPVVNASPLILLARANRLELLASQSSRIHVPGPVAEELQARSEDDPAVRALRTREWLEVVESPPIPDRIRAWDLGAGESSVLACCLARKDPLAIIDDLAGRRCAEALGVRVRGTLGLVLRAKREGRIPSARRELETLRLAGMYLSAKVVKRALALVGE